MADRRGTAAESAGVDDTFAPGRLPQDEIDLHGSFVLRHIDRVTELLAAEHVARDWQYPAGCPHSTPALTARRRKDGESAFPCVTARITHPTGGLPDEISDRHEGRWTHRERDHLVDGTCICGDPLCGSDDPIHAVLAVVLAPDGKPPRERYFDGVFRETIAALVEEFDNLLDLADAPRAEILDIASERDVHRPGREGIERLQEAIRAVDRHRYTDGPTLVDLPGVKYELLAEMLEGLPGISERDAWWLLLTALDKPVWPADPKIDALAAEFGLLPRDSVCDVTAHRPEMAEQLVDRQVLDLHRWIAGHVRYGAAGPCDETCPIRKFCLEPRLVAQNWPEGPRLPENRDGPVAVDMFCGAGGLSVGLRESGFQVALAVDNDEYAPDTYRLNHPEIPHSRVRREDITNIREETDLLDRLRGEVDLLVGGPPCQAFSLAGNRSRAGPGETPVRDDPRSDLYREYVGILEELRPSVVLMENVDGIRAQVTDGDRIIDDVEDAIEGAGYRCSHSVVDASKVGIPQLRERVIIIGVRDDLVGEISTADFVDRLFEMDIPGDLADLELTVDTGDGTALIQQILSAIEEGDTRTPDLADALSGLPLLGRGEGTHVVAGRRPGNRSEYAKSVGKAGNAIVTHNHRARRHPREKDRELFEIMDPGETGWEVKYERGRPDLIDYDVGTEDSPSFHDKYRKLEWDRPCHTIVAHLAKDANSFILPDPSEYQPDRTESNPRLARGITPREAARVQTFADDHPFLGPFIAQFRQIGNAVPPLLGSRCSAVIQALLDVAPAEVTGVGATETVSEGTADD